MAKNRVLSPAQKAMRQRIDAGFAASSAAGEPGSQSKADLRASIPAYDEAMVRKVPAKTAPKTRKR